MSRHGEWRAVIRLGPIPVLVGSFVEKGRGAVPG